MDHHPILCALPPYMLNEIVQRGTPAQRRLAINNLRLSDQLRSQRQVLTNMVNAMSEHVMSSGKQRFVYDANFGTALPGTLLRREGDPPTGDAAVNEAYEGSGATYDLFYNVYGRDSIDAHGMDLRSSVHYRQGYDNAFWNGDQMVYGDGDEDLPVDERLFNRFTIALDIIAHELTHGVTQFEARLTYSKQPGALNESFSDVFGALVKQYRLRQTAAEADWLIGAGLLTENVQGQGIRSMKAPGSAYDDPVLGKDPQPAHMDQYIETESDNGGVHLNSGIPNHAFYVTACELGGFAWEKAGLIWYMTLRDKLGAGASFQQAAWMTYDLAGVQFGKGSLEQQAVRAGWNAVGLDATVQAGSSSPSGCPSGLMGLLNSFAKRR